MRMCHVCNEQNHHVNDYQSKDMTRKSEYIWYRKRNWQLNVLDLIDEDPWGMAVDIEVTSHVCSNRKTFSYHMEINGNELT